MRAPVELIPPKLEVVDGRESEACRKLEILRREMNELFYEREALIDLVLTTLVSGGCLFIGGMPGTAKTGLVKAIASAFDMRSRYQLFQVDTMPSEFVGRTEAIEYIDVEGNKRTKFQPDIEGGILDTDIFIADECFKGNSPALNSQLGIMIDRVYQIGKTKIQAPLQAYIGMSNELPTDKKLAAYWNRFNLKIFVDYLSDNGLDTLMDDADERPIGARRAAPTFSVSMTKDDLLTLRAKASRLRTPPLLKRWIRDIANQARLEGMAISDRQIADGLATIKAFTTVIGGEEIDAEKLWVLRSMFWDNLPHIAKLERIISTTLNSPDDLLMIKVQESIRDAEAMTDLEAAADGLRLLLISSTLDPLIAAATDKAVATAKRTIKNAIDKLVAQMADATPF